MVELLLSSSVMANKASNGGIKLYSESVGSTLSLEIDKRIMIGVSWKVSSCLLFKG